MKLFLFILILSLSGCSVLSQPVDLKDPSEVLIQVTAQFPDQSIKVFTLSNFSPLSVLLKQIDCELCDLSQLNPQMILKDGDIIVFSEVAGLGISINQATLEELLVLPGIGETYAQRIIDYRNTHGYFQTIEDLMKVKGIKTHLFNKIKAYLKL
jgi:competence protein ComEA